jgi:hypothetical protein
MANIIQAAKWLQEGKQIRRSNWVLSSVYELRCGALCWISGEKAVPAARLRITAEELLADDWEVAE